MIEISLSRPEIFGEIGNICYLLSLEPSLGPEMRRRIADVLDRGNIDLVNRAVAHGFSQMIHRIDSCMNGSVGATSEAGFGSADEYRFSFSPPAGWRSTATLRLRSDLFAYLVECGLCGWFMIVAPQLLQLHFELRDRYLSGAMTTLQTSGGAPSRIVPRPF